MPLSPEILLLIAIFILIILSAFFSGSETALTVISKAKIHKLMQKGYKKAHYINKLRLSKDHLISNILVGNNLVNILASALATKLCLDYFGDNGVIYATIIMTFIVVLFAEIIPKTYALYNTDKTSLFVAPILNILFKIINPIASIIRFFASLFLSKSTTEDESENKSNLISAIDELRGNIEVQHKEGSILKHDRDMLDSILDLSIAEVSQVMTHRKSMLTINLDDSNEKIIETISKSTFTRIPLWKDKKDNIVGILHAKDVLKTTTYSTKKTKEIDFLKVSTKPWFIPENTTLREQLFAFKKERAHFAIVVDEYGSVEGIVTLEDILEEIVGDIKDEHDKGTTENYTKIDDNTYLVSGTVTVRDINRDLDLEFPEDDASTVAGLLINACEKIPEREEEFTLHNFKFKVLEKRKNQITKLQLTKTNS
jgi:Mg2+/Co2+ transporter CorB